MPTSNIRIIERSIDERVTVEGDLNCENAAQFESQMKALSSDPGQIMILDFSVLDIEDGVAIATAINVLRELRSRTNHLVIVGAPQMLGHNLYRVGLLDGNNAIDLVDMRQDEPAGF